MLDFRVLGPLEVAGDRGLLRLGGLKQRATLAILLLNVNRVVSVERLADDLYAGAAPLTAVTQVQRQISELRKALGSPSVIETRAPGYVLRLAPGLLDLDRFERLTDEASRALAVADATRAAGLLREALDLWRGAPLGDLAFEPFAQAAVCRLDEIRLAALEQRIDADLALHRHAALVGELEQLTVEHPLRERFLAQLMLALYRSGRQAEALDVYRGARETLMDAFGIEPTTALRELQHSILNQNTSLDLPQPLRDSHDAGHVVLAVTQTGRLEALCSVAERLAELPGGQLILAHLLSDSGSLGEAATVLNSRRDSIAVPVRTAAFTTVEPARDIVRLATHYDVELVLLEAQLDATALPTELAESIEASPADVAILVGPKICWEQGDGIFVPFGGGEHDWAALELGARLASAAAAPLKLLGTSAVPIRGRRDASRLLADAALAVQSTVGVASEPLLVEPGEDGLVAAVAAATVVVVGISPRWRQEGIGAMRRALVTASGSATLLVHRGPRPGGLAPSGSRTRFTWSIGC